MKSTEPRTPMERYIARQRLWIWTVVIAVLILLHI